MKHPTTRGPLAKKGNGLTYSRTDTTSYRDAWPHLQSYLEIKWYTGGNKSAKQSVWFHIKSSFQIRSIHPDYIYPGNISEIKEIMNFGWCWQESGDNRVVHFDGGLGHRVSNRLHFFVEILQLLIYHRPKNSLDLRFLEVLLHIVSLIVRNE